MSSLSTVKRSLIDLATRNLGIRNVNRIRRFKAWLTRPFENDAPVVANYRQTEPELNIGLALLDTFAQGDRPTVLDIGANIGGYSQHISAALQPRGGRCIGFEPRSDLNARLRRNVRQPNFVAERLAISDSEGIAEIYMPPSHGLSSLVPMPGFAGYKSEHVAKTTVDRYVEAHEIKNIVMIKIDVEGHELEALAGATETLTREQPVVLCESENRHLIPQGKRVDQLIEFFAKLGYGAWVMSFEQRRVLAVSEISIPVDREPGVEYFNNFWLVPHAKRDAALEIMQRVVAARV
ncbi:MAG: FkbM family methyltransferase [Planctomycetaceae bacterium]|nr:FkbM family methyltransferase [Planctomycetaceae bacterium]